MNGGIGSQLIPDAQLEDSFRHTKRIVQGWNERTFFDWWRAALWEIRPNVQRSLCRKYNGCVVGGFRIAKIAGLYAFWTAKLKPGFSNTKKCVMLNEYTGLHIGIAYVRERLGVQVRLEREEFLEMCETLRYHTTSPHTMMHIFALWIERERLRKPVK